MAKQEFFTDENGVVRPITPPKPRNRGVVVAVTVTLALAAGSAGAVTAVGASDVTVTVNTARAASGSKGSARSRGRDRSGQDVLRRLERRGLRVERRTESFSTDCAAHSYGQVQDFFQAHPCDALFRGLYEVRGAGGSRVLVAVAWVDMPDVAGAIEFKNLVDRWGTGNITELSKEQSRYRRVRFTGQQYASVQDGSTVVNAQVEPLGSTAVGVSTARAVLSEIS